MAEENEVNVKDAVQAIGELRKSLETVSEGNKTLEEKMASLSGVEKSKVEKIEKDLEKFDKAHNDMVLEKKKSENEKKEMEERIGNLESQLVKSSTDSKVSYKETMDYKAFNELVKINQMTKSELKEEYKSYLRTDIGSEGGFLVPEVYDVELLKQITEISPVRSLSKVKNRRGVKTLNQRIRTTLPSASYQGEHEAGTKTKPSYIMEVLTAHRQTVEIEITRDELLFSDFDMSSEIGLDAVTAFAQSEGNKFLLGTSNKQPQGIIAGNALTGIEEIDSAASGVVSMDDVIQLSGEMKIGYNPFYTFNRKTLVGLRTEKDSNGNYLWRFGGESQPTTINGFSYVLLQDMPDVASDSLSVLFGDFFRGYTILDAMDTELIRDDFTLASEASVNFVWHRWNDGRVVLAEAFKILKTKA